MPELVTGGPLIPVRLLNELDSGKVVFFCGAGISMGPGSDLPNFADLVRHVYEANRLEPDSVESEALDLEEPDPDRRRPTLDKALGLLERESRLGARALRESVIKRISAPPSGELSIHEALIDLSRNKGSIRLITTNFDDRFVRAGLDTALVDSAPKLPVPKPHTWSSLVHLHGRISGEEDGSNLVLTAADFGRAYLTERWAARFVTELFREFTVVFVGYSVGDPVMSYMVDALAAERAKGVRFSTAYAFADADGSEADRSKVRDGWRAKNVEPILYDRQDDHRLLADTLVEWAAVRKDPFHARSRIAINEMTRMPDNPVAERVVWALNDPVAAKALANEPPVVDEDEFRKLEQWLDIFAEQGLLKCDAGDFESGASDRFPALVGLVDNGFRSENPDTLDMTRTWLSVWLARHLHVPQLLGWVLRNGGHLHPHLRQEVRRQLAAKDSNIPERLRLLWTVLMDNRRADPWWGLWTSGHYAAATSDMERRRIEEEVIESIAPRLIVRPGPPPLRPRPVSPIDACGHLKLAIGDEDVWHRVRELLQDPEVISRRAETLTGHLELALSLGKEDDEAYPNSILYRPSIAAHGQNPDHDMWAHLIDLVRDSYFAVARVERRRAENLLLRWAESRHPLFRRQALHALTENPKSDIRLARNLLIGGRKPSLWDLEMHREALRFFRLAGKRLPRTLRAEIVRAIHAGPKAKKGWSSSGDFDRLRHQKALLLHKLSVSGARLDRKSRALAEEAAARAPDDDERDEFLVWHGEVRWVGDDEFAPMELVEGSVADVVTALEEERVGQDGLRGLVVLKRVKVASALRRLAKQGVWPASYWHGFLWHLSEPCERNGPSARLHDHVARVLAEAPDALFNEIGSAAASFVSQLAEKYGTDREDEFRLLWMKAWTGREDVEPAVVGLDDPLTDALNHPAGKLAEAALARLRKYEPEMGAGLSGAVRLYFDAIGEDPDGRLGRVMLATQLHYLFAVDPGWAREHIIARLHPGRSQEAASLWFAYGWSPRVGPDLLRAFKRPFLEILRSEAPEYRKLRNLGSLFMEVCLEAPEELTEQEIHGVVDALPDKGLRTVLGSLKRRLTGDAAEREQVWREKIRPWLDEYWPQAAVRNTAGTSQEILELLIECGSAFAEAAEWSLEYLRPIERPELYRLLESGHAEQYPESMIRVLDRVVDAEVLQVFERHHLREILDALVGAKPDMAGNPQFRRLYKIATQ
ncbi:MAG: SIR2 family protein [Alphaproteobacteria bacterium]|nr:SIR2 family protein [Alphaproteobacteria bacterium]